MANMGGNALLMAFQEPLYELLGLAPPADPYALASVLGFSFTAGALALAIFLRPAHAVPMLVVAMLGKASFALVTLNAHLSGGVAWPWLAFAAWDAVFVVVFWMYLIHLLRPELASFNRGAVLASPVPAGETRQALLLCYSLSGNSGRAVESTRRGLEAGGYRCDVVRIKPLERELFQFPFTSVMQFVRIALRAVLRRPAEIEPLELPADCDPDLIVVASQTWMVGAAAPVEELFRRPDTRALFAGRDVALINVARGLWRRSQAILASRVEEAGGNLVAARAETNPGREPTRTLSLFVFLMMGRTGHPSWLPKALRQPQYLSEDALMGYERWGTALARRSTAGLSPLAWQRAAVLDAALREQSKRSLQESWQDLLPERETEARESRDPVSVANAAITSSVEVGA
ncbi:hypothetical protein [Haliangium ochraceum]|uniref:hypothetical protein n=1 Tax=Haliangium ochraceum TaxID=80816 RepID=UPI00030EBD52|nr:hypothetical protein [Haliangium ochraceum]